MTLDLKAELRQYGAADEAIKLLHDRADASLLRYVDLFPEALRRKGMTGMPMPDGVVEHADRPLIYVYRSDSLAGSPEEAERRLAQAVRGLACRDDGSYLAVVHAGQLDVYPVGMLRNAPKSASFKASPEHVLLVHDLASGNVPALLRQQMATARSLHKMLYDLITGVAKELRDSRTLSITRERDEVLPLVGRAVFARFLIDRGIINQKTFPALWANDGRPEHAFATPELAATTCVWLDTKFNGDLLPLLPDKGPPNYPTYEEYLGFFTRHKRIATKVLHQLTNIMYRAPDGRLSLALSWEGVDFAHVPIGLLSEVYEDYAHEFYGYDALRESVRYTPRHIAEFTVDHAFGGLNSSERHTARVLDPACGAGIFLVLTFQRLVAERWRSSGKRPDTADIRAILNEQIRGFDINHSAMTLAALSLYLTALELDPDPFPPEKLRFDRLLGGVLRNMRGPDEDFATYDGLVLGSLGEQGNLKRREAPYDIVLGNPPWTAFDEWGDSPNAFSAHTVEMVQRILAKRRRGEPELAGVADEYRHNDNIPDVAFLWRAIEWTRDDGVIAFIMAGRFLFKRGDQGGAMRDALFKALRFTGILNGALLMPLWKKINQPFCIVFARNSTPKMSDRFTLVTPMLDTSPAREPRMRIDAEARAPIEIGAAIKRPHLFKVLTRGGRLDADVIERIQNLLTPQDVTIDEDGSTAEQPASAMSIGKVWGMPWTQGKERSGQGYFPVGKKTKKPSKQASARMAELIRRGALTLTSDELTDALGDLRIGLRINPRQLKQFTAQKLYRIVQPDVFDPPQVLIKEGFGKSPQGARARLYLGKAPLVYRRNFYGFSCAGHPRGAQMAKYLFCVINSDLFGYYTLLASAKFGLERRTLLVEDIEDFPILHDLTEAQWQQIETAADDLSLDDQASWVAMNRCVNKLYGLTPSDEQVIRDTLSTMMPYEDSQTRAMAPATRGEIEAFRDKLQSTLQPLFTPDGQKISVVPFPIATEGWAGFEVRTGCASSASQHDLVAALASRLAEQEGLTRVIQRVAPGLLRVAVLNQYRYLTLSRARLCAIDIMRDHGDVFPMSEAL